MMQKSLLLDTDVVIGLHELEYWDGVIRNNLIFVASTVARVEATHYFKGKEKISIDMLAYISKKEIKEESASAQEQSKVIMTLEGSKLKLDDGELESIAIIVDNKVPGLQFCVIDNAAIKALTFLKLEDKAIPVQQMLIDSGIIKENQEIDFKYSNRRFNNFIRDGRFLLIENA